ncbi:diguanylate cyclase [Butyrivibrio sp. JL13D10]|uniref:GGDEF domain-containing protein n=1 Tax=Butyrivibrio sp. JL13D10 TaxID=3236815 RepID=UPI0038B42E99
MLFSCIVRKAFWERYVDMELEPYEQLCSTSGFYTWGEIIRDEKSGEIVEHNVTQLSIAMREGEGKAEELPEVWVDDTVLKGPAAQMRRLTSLVYTTMEELQNAQRDLQILNDKLRTMAEKDALTGLYNRGKTEEIIYNLLDESAFNKVPLSLLMIDIDHFKSVNDNYSHQTGDLVLKEMAAILENLANEHTDAMAGRWGGEEFFVILPGVVDDEAMSIAETLRKRTENHIFPEVGNLTISVGVITVAGDTNSKDIFLCVDKALYDAKEGGRNRVVRADLSDDDRTFE